MRDRRNQQASAVAMLGEEVWIKPNVSTHRQGLATSTNAVLSNTVFQMDALREINQTRPARRLNVRPTQVGRSDRDADVDANGVLGQSSAKHRGIRDRDRKS